MPHKMTALNQMNQAEFTAALGEIFEQTPQVAQQAWQSRPFASRADLHQKMLAVVAQMSQGEKLALIRAHPDLGSKAKMAAASVQEQAGAGLNQLSADEFERLHRLNQAYRSKFGFPFIIAVKQQNKIRILATFEQRLTNSPEAEQAQAIAEIAQIAGFRLETAVDE
ncbi:MAG: 2-oxo-4-hydroxy-4-carboxy-5-ureidoimidazoline decarboxylase [Pegethrix bostrychoides GSE-TBD4-15B]|uniref:2-oxo-4-hydroxy-4-carboxy-5-ureidoimidazoline decarboxylase n=1 Tax=Pegethrix bostrychoides GSE-TBD4-15B TaxID=2839662 RepID=A0A951U343_9CYAN|nr:2-oxo-4-hydroxy-4-carboxy-5-ureidoimidazoline decarboxylase [Pegethrix bostrychoides GSE-TBD4-15B]